MWGRSFVCRIIFAVMTNFHHKHQTPSGIFLNSLNSLNPKSRDSMSVGFIPPYDFLPIIRWKIDYIDNTIYRLLVTRMDIAKRTTMLKKEVRDPEREEQIIQRLNHNRVLDTRFVEETWTLIFNESRRLQQEDVTSSWRRNL